MTISKPESICKQRGILVVGAFAILQAALWSDSHSPNIASAFVVRQSSVSMPHHRRPDAISFIASRSDRFHYRDERRVAVMAATEDTSSITDGMDFENMEILQDLVIASSLSYLSLEPEVGEDGQSSSSSKMEASPYFSTKFKPLRQVVDPKTESGATIFEYGSSIVVACRGSATPINFSTNLRFRLVPLLDSTGDSEFLVHEGFQEATIGLWKQLTVELETILSSNKKDYSGVIFTGHSLGAANALLCGTVYQKTGKTPLLSGVITFGGPRLVNIALAEDLNKNLMGPPVVVKNYVHSKDPILRQNGPLWDSLGFGIVGTEIPCEPFEAKAYHSPQEQAEYNTKDLPLAWNILDHCNYLGVFVGPRLL